MQQLREEAVVAAEDVEGADKDPGIILFPEQELSVGRVVTVAIRRTVAP